MRRGLFNLAVAMSLGTCVVAIWLWARSARTTDRIDWQGAIDQNNQRRTLHALSSGRTLCAIYNRRECAARLQYRMPPSAWESCPASDHETRRGGVAGFWWNRERLRYTRKPPAPPFVDSTFYLQ